MDLKEIVFLVIGILLGTLWMIIKSLNDDWEKIRAQKNKLKAKGKRAKKKVKSKIKRTLK